MITFELEELLLVSLIDFEAEKILFFKLVSLLSCPVIHTAIFLLRLVDRSKGQYPLTL